MNHACIMHNQWLIYNDLPFKSFMSKNKVKFEG